MAVIVQYDPSHPIVANAVTVYLRSANTAEYETFPGSGIPIANTLINPNLTAVAGVSVKYWKTSTGNVVEMTSTGKAAIDNAVEEQAESSTRRAEIEERQRRFYKCLRRIERWVDAGTYTQSAMKTELIDEWGNGNQKDTDFLFYGIPGPFKNVINNSASLSSNHKTILTNIIDTGSA